MPALADVLAQRLDALEAQQLRRRLVDTARTDEMLLQRDGKTYISFSCNNYLGLAQDARVIASAQEALATHGAGGGASRLVTGQHPLHAALEARLAAHQGSEAALLFGSGYLANLGVLTALMGPEDLILLDKLSHACLIDGARLSEATWMRFKHNDVKDAARLLAKHRASHRHCLIVTETVFSMDGDRAPLAALRTLADTHDAWLMADDAHGLYQSPSPSRGEDGRGALWALYVPSRPHPIPPPIGEGDMGFRCLAETSNQQLATTTGSTDNEATKSYVDLLTGTLSKALGSYGGYVCAARPVIEYLATAARSFMFTTALPPATLAAALAALEIAEAEPERAERALAHARRFCEALGLPAPESQIVPILFGEAAAALEAMQQLQNQGLLVTAIRPPTVPKGTARLRVSFSAAHTDAQVEALIAALRPLLAPAPERRHG